MSIVQKLRNSELVQNLGPVQLKGKEKGRKKSISVRNKLNCKREKPQNKDGLSKRDIYFSFFLEKHTVEKSRASMTPPSHQGVDLPSAPAVFFSWSKLGCDGLSSNV